MFFSFVVRESSFKLFLISAPCEIKLQSSVIFWFPCSSMPTAKDAGGFSFTYFNLVSNY